MWITLLVMAIAVTLEPFRIGMTVLMLNRPRPVLQLLAFLCGGFAMGLSVGLVVLFALRQTSFVSSNFTLPKVQITIGVLALLLAAALTVTIPARRSVAATVRRPGPGTAVERPPGVLAKLTGRARNLLEGRSLWVAGAAGLSIALPSVDYMAALAVILASGAAPPVQVGALVVFNAVAFTLVEIPLVSYLLAPDRTRAFMAALHDRIRSRRRRDVALLLAMVGGILIAVGVIGL